VRAERGAEDEAEEERREERGEVGEGADLFRRTLAISAPPTLAFTG
jgi:hypothetical protein